MPMNVHCYWLDFNITQGSIGSKMLNLSEKIKPVSLNRNVQYVI